MLNFFFNSILFFNKELTSMFPSFDVMLFFQGILLAKFLFTVHVYYIIFP